MAIQSHFFVSVISYLHNDADILEDLLVETMAVLKNNYQHFEIVLVDSGSQDDTINKVNALLKKYEDIRYIRLSRNFGEDMAISAGLDSAIGDVIVVLDPQGDPPALIPDMVAQVRQVDGIVFGVKESTKNHETLFYRLGRKIFNFICKKSLTFVPPDNASFFIGLNRQALNVMVQMGGKSKFIRVFGAYSGFGKQIFQYMPKYRRKQPKKRGFLEAVIYGVDIITNNSIYPLRLVSFLGLILSGLNLLYIIYVFLVFLLKKNVMEGWVTSSLQVSTMFLMVFIVLTVLSKYIGVLLSEIKNSPSYIIEGEKNSSVILENKKNVFRESMDEKNNR
jgi:polyisoprenyl-phosphate glycosyltransferase